MFLWDKQEITSFLLAISSLASLRSHRFCGFEHPCHLWAVASAAERAQSLTNLEISQSVMIDDLNDDHRHLVRAIQSLLHLEEFRMFYPLGAAIVPVLQNGSLKFLHLGLASCPFSLLFDALRTNETLQDLCLTFAPDEIVSGVVALAEVLQVNLHMQCLQLFISSYRLWGDLENGSEQNKVFWSSWDPNNNAISALETMMQRNYSLRYMVIDDRQSAIIDFYAKLSHDVSGRNNSKGLGGCLVVVQRYQRQVASYGELSHWLQPNFFIQ